MTVRTVADLRAALDDFPAYWPVGLEVYVGGDLITDVVDLGPVKVTTGSAGNDVVLGATEDVYGVVELVDEALEQRERIHAQGIGLARTLAGVPPWMSHHRATRRAT